MFDAAIASVSAARCLPPHLPPRPVGRTVIVGAGKAAAAMAQVVEQHWNGPFSGVVLTRHGHSAPCTRIEVREAGHPIPDEAGVEAAQAMLARLEGLGSDDLVLCLLSGGGSSLLAAPPPGATLGDVRAVSDALLRSGADIVTMNRVRRHLSMLAGGRLAAAAGPAQLVTLAISDVPNDDPAIIASGPTVSDGAPGADALAILDGLGVAVPSSVRAWLASPQSALPPPKRCGDVTYRIIARAEEALDAAARVASDAGYEPLLLGAAIEGPAEMIAADHAKKVRHLLRLAGEPRRVALLSGGETSVTVKGAGIGGRNTQFLLALVTELDGFARVHALAADTDGIDGSEDNAGAIIDPTTSRRARERGLDPHRYLADNDAYSFFAALDDLVITGPTRTNVNDFRAILIDRTMHEDDR